MPLELSNPEGWFPYHYDPRYEHTRPGNPSIGIAGLEDYLQGMSTEVTGRPLSKEGLIVLMNHLDSKGLLYMNKGDEIFRDEVIRYLKRLKMAKKVAYGRSK